MDDFRKQKQTENNLEHWQPVNKSQPKRGNATITVTPPAGKPFIWSKNQRRSSKGVMPACSTTYVVPLLPSDTINNYSQYIVATDQTLSM